MTTYNTLLTDTEKMPVLDSTLMDELLHQSDEIKLLIINKFSGSLIKQKDAEQLKIRIIQTKRNRSLIRRVSCNR